MLLRLLLFLAVARLTLAAPAQREIPDTIWEPLCFRSINRFTNEAGWPPLPEMEIAH
jgi:hypothetical protein